MKTTKTTTEVTTMAAVAICVATFLHVVVFETKRVKEKVRKT